MSSSARRTKTPSDAESGLQASVRSLPGVGARREDILKALGIATVGDLLTYPPARYIDRQAFTRIADLRHGELQTVTGKVASFEIKFVRGRRLASVALTDGTGILKCVWFNQTYLKNVFKPGADFVLSGTVRTDRGGPSMVHPEYESADAELVSTGRIVPVYRTRSGFSQKMLRALAMSAIDTSAGELTDLVPASAMRALGLPGLAVAVARIHFPSSLKQAEAARRRLAFDEMLLFQTLFALARKGKREAGGEGDAVPGEVEALTSLLKFALTRSQTAALAEVVRDLAGGRPMRRLIQGDVGCGKTVVAALGAALVANRGGQVALLCPTEILAEQHRGTLARLLEPLGHRVELVLGGAPPEERSLAEAAIARGAARVVVGTHALLAERLKFHDLRLVIVDEEQRFGVLQRTKLIRDVPLAHLLVLSATPIPRTLALTAYGDLDITVIDELPPGRGRHTTRVVKQEARAEALGEVASIIGRGLQGFYVCPALEETSADLVNVRSARREMDGLIPGGRRTAILTGRTSREERARILKGFVSNRIGLIVATSVVEVGMDIPAATVLVVDQAERFGLAQLHQMRGRVARSAAESFSYLVVSDSASERAWERLATLESTFDGFEVAEKDLVLRGPGDVVGTRQHGIPDLKFASLPEDLDLMLKAREQAFKHVLEDEPPADWRPWIDAVKKVMEARSPVV
ncbi:MAG: ATP-dependent DNA helicase RecG [bacterium]